MLGVVQQVVDDGQVFEIAQDYAKNIITGELAATACLKSGWLNKCGELSCRVSTMLLFPSLNFYTSQASHVSTAALWEWWPTSPQCWLAAWTSTHQSRCGCVDLCVLLLRQCGAS